MQEKFNALIEKLAFNSSGFKGVVSPTVMGGVTPTVETPTPKLDFKGPLASAGGMFHTTPSTPVEYTSPMEQATKHVYGNPETTKQQFDQAAEYAGKNLSVNPTVSWERYNEKVPVYGENGRDSFSTRYTNSNIIGGNKTTPNGFINIDQDQLSEITSPRDVVYNNMSGPTLSDKQDVLQHEMNHTTDADRSFLPSVSPFKYPKLLGIGGVRDDINYFDRPNERQQAIRSLQQGMYKDLGHRAETPEQFKGMVERYLNHTSGFNRDKLTPEQQRYLNYMENVHGEKTLDTDAKLAPALSANYKDNPNFKMAFEKRAAEWYAFLS